MYVQMKRIDSISRIRSQYPRIPKILLQNARTLLINLKTSANLNDLFFTQIKILLYIVFTNLCYNYILLRQFVASISVCLQLAIVNWLRRVVSTINFRHAIFFCYFLTNDLTNLINLFTSQKTNNILFPSDLQFC